jgi:cobalt-zinc-cadmium efflux system outer membrane protein
MNGNNTLRGSARIFLCLIFVAGTASPQSVPAPSAQSEPTSGQAPLAERFSVEQAVQAALAQNLALRAELQRIPVAEGQLRQAGLIPNPVMTSTDTSDRYFANEGEGDRSAGIQQEIETAGKRRYRSLTARSDLERVRHETESTQRDLIARTQKAYFTLVFAERDLGLARETSAILRRFVDLNAERVKVGEAPGVELNLAKIELARSQRNEQEFQRRYREATAGLNLLMGRPPAASVLPASDFAAPLSLPPDQELLDYGVQHRPEVLAADRNVEARTSAVRLARALRFPNVSLGGAYQKTNSVVGVGGPPVPGQTTQVLRHDQLAFTLTLPLPLFNRNQGNIASADYERRSAEETAQYVRNVVASEIATALVNYRSRVQTRALYEESVLPQLQRNVDAIQEAYRLGNESIFAVIQVQRTFFDTRHEYLQTLLDLEFDRVDLEKATVRPLR